MGFLMDILGSIATGGWSAVLGGITGVIGSILKNRHDLQVRKLDMEEAGSIRTHDLNLMDKEAEHALDMADASLNEARMGADYRGLTQSIKADVATYSAAWAEKVTGTLGAIIAAGLALVDFIRGLVRPAITLYFAWLLSSIWGDFFGKALKEITGNPDLVSSMATSLLNTIIFLATTAIGWWFGTRPPKQPDTKARA